MILVIAEKPSVAQTIAAVLGAKEKKDGFLTGSGYIVSWCVGHLVGLTHGKFTGHRKGLSRRIKGRYRLGGVLENGTFLERRIFPP